MGVSTEFTDYILDLLSPVGTVTSSAMFSGILLKVDGKQLGILFSETMYFKVTDEALQAEYKKKGSTQFSYTRKDKKDPVVIKNWWSVPEDALDSGEDLVILAEAVLQQEKL